MAVDEGIEIYGEREESMDVNNEAEVKTELEKGKGDENVLQFLDSLDGYLTLMDSVNSKLREVMGMIFFVLEYESKIGSYGVLLYFRSIQFSKKNLVSISFQSLDFV